MHRTPSSDAVRPTRRAISPRFAIRTEVMGAYWGSDVDESRARWWGTLRIRASTRGAEVGRIGVTLETFKTKK